MGNIGLPELLVILAICLVLFGAGRLPDIAKQMGKAVQEFKKALKDDDAGKSGDGTDGSH